MVSDWESWLRAAARPASQTEQQRRDRTEVRIREAIRSGQGLPASVRVFVKGSYANNTNVRGEADVDVAVEWTNVAYVDTWGDTAGLTPAQLDYAPVSFDITQTEFRSRVERALLRNLGAAAVGLTGDKAIDVAANSGTLDADVIPCFSLHRYDAPRYYHVGHRIFPKSGGFVDNFPQQNYDNGVAKNNMTGGRFKDIVRCVKRLEGVLLANGSIPKEYPGYLIECLIYNVPNDHFGHSTLYRDMQAVLRFLWNGLKDSNTYDTWTEVSQLLMLFRGSSSRNPSNALHLIDKTWNTIGVE